MILADALERAAQLFGGANLIKGVGSWCNPAGEVVIENSAVIVIDTASHNEQAVRNFAKQVARDLNQASVHFVTLDAVAENIDV